MKSSSILLFVSLCGLAFNPLSACQSVQNDSLETIVDAILEDYAGNNKPGATIGVIKNGKLIFQKGYGMANLEAGVANHPNVAYNIASGSKQFTAAIIASLIQQNKLALTDDIRKHIPQFKDYGKPLTIENLLYHTSGIRDYMVLMWLTGKSFEEPFTNKEAVDMIVQQEKLNFAPGDHCVYSNSNYILLAEIIQRVTGTTLAEYAEKNLFKPVEMNCSGFDTGITECASYRKIDTTYISFNNNYAAYGDGGMVTTLADLVQWDRTFYDDSTLTQLILKRGTLNNGAMLEYGMGIIVSTYRNEQIHTHPGAFLGFRSEILRFPKKGISIICLGNSSEIDPELITRSIADRYVFSDSKEVNPVKPESKSLSIEQVEALTGTFEVAQDVLIEIRYEDGVLTGQASGQPRQILYDNGGNSFSIGSTGDLVVFDGIENGKFQKLIVRQKQGNTIAHRLAEVAVEDHERFTGQYYCKEQNTTYNFYSVNGCLWFSVGSSGEVKANVIQKYNRVYFSYFNLERAVIDFNVNSDGSVNGFVLNSGRISDLQFIKN